MRQIPGIRDDVAELLLTPYAELPETLRESLRRASPFPGGETLVSMLSAWADAGGKYLVKFVDDGVEPRFYPIRRYRLNNSAGVRFLNAWGGDDSTYPFAIPMTDDIIETYYDPNLFPADQDVEIDVTYKGSWFDIPASWLHGCDEVLP